MPSLNAKHVSLDLLHSLLPTCQGSCYHALILIRHRHAFAIRRARNGDWYLLDSELDQPVRLNNSIMQSLRGTTIIAIKGGDCISYLPSTRANPLWLAEEATPSDPHTHATSTTIHMHGPPQSSESHQRPSVAPRTPQARPHRQAPPYTLPTTNQSARPATCIQALKVLAFNVQRGLFNSRCEVREKISAHKPDILVLTEIRSYEKKSNRNTQWLGSLLADYLWWSAPRTT